MNFGSLQRWVSVSKKDTLRLDIAAPKRVRFEVNAPDAVRVTLCYGDQRFCFRVLGLERVECALPAGDLEITVSGECWLLSPEFDLDTAFVIPDAVSFTRVVGRRQRNPELELMMAKMNANMERRLAHAERELARRYAAPAAPAAANAAEPVAQSGSGEAPVDAAGSPGAGSVSG